MSQIRECTRWSWKTWDLWITQYMYVPVHVSSYGRKKASVVVARWTSAAQRSHTCVVVTSSEVFREDKQSSNMAFHRCSVGVPRVSTGLKLNVRNKEGYCVIPILKNDFTLQSSTLVAWECQRCLLLFSTFLRCWGPHLSCRARFPRRSFCSGRQLSPKSKRNV